MKSILYVEIFNSFHIPTHINLNQSSHIDIKSKLNEYNHIYELNHICTNRRYLEIQGIHQGEATPTHTNLDSNLLFYLRG